MITLKHLTVKNVRGIGPTGPDLSLERTNLMICGENGTGKSSYLDALEYVLTRQSSSLDIGKRGVSWDLGGQHILGKGPAAVVATLTNGAGTDFQIDLTSNVDGLVEPLRSWIRRARQDKFVLRRRAMLEFLDAEPRLRYDALAAFLALEEYQVLEQQLRDLTQSLTSKVQAAEADVANAVAGLRSAILVKSDLGEKAVIESYNQFLVSRGWQPLRAMVDLVQQQKKVESEIAAFGNVDQATRLQAVLNSISQVPALEGLLIDLHSADVAFNNHAQMAADMLHGFYPEVLEGGLKWIDEQRLDYCPLCERGFEDREVARKRILERLEENAEFTRSKKALQERLDSVHGRLSQLVQSLNLVVQSLNAANVSDTRLSPVIDALSLMQSHYPVGKAKDNETVEDTDRLTALDIPGVIKTLENEFLSLLQMLPGLERYRVINEVHRVAVSVLTHFAALKEAQDRQLAAAGHKGQAELLAEMATKARKAAVQQAVEEVAAEANRLYAKVHPGEKIGDARLKVPNRGQGSLDLDADFYTKRADPRLLFSESHLDTMGLCFFLAVRRLNATRYPNFKLLVLDDVLHSVDASHRQRTAEMLLDEFRDHQMLITTHDPLWFQRFRTVSSNKGVPFSFRRIGGWSLETGPQWGDFETDHEFLKASLHTGRIEDIAASTGRLMEEVLQTLCEQLSVAVPFRRSARYEIGMMWGPFLKSAKKHQGFWAKAEKVCTELDSFLWIRNETGAHFNPSPIPTTPTEVKAFAKATMDLVKLCSCSNCDQFIQEVQAPAGNWTCRCGNLTYSKTALAAMVKSV